MASSLPPDALLSGITALASSQPTTVLLDVADRLERSEAPALRLAAEVLAHIPVVASRDAVKQFFSAWQVSHPNLSAQAVAWSLRAAAAMDAWHRAAQSLEVVWTGPAPAGTVLRRTDQALYELVRTAKTELLLVTFAAYKVDRLRLALQEASERGIRLTFVVESPDVGDGRVSFDPMIAFGGDLGANVWVWPEAQRPKDEKGRHGTLHAKCALADEQSLLVSSANFTGDALGLNLELGLLVEGGAAPRTVREHFRELMRGGVLELALRGTPADPIAGKRLA